MTLVLESEYEFLSFDMYELPGDNRLFFIIHIYNRKWVGGYSKYSLGQLTEAPSGYKVISTVSMYLVYVPNFKMV